MARLTLNLLGGFEAWLGEAELTGSLGRKGRALLAWLALHLDRRMRREAAVDLLWGDRPERQARASLSQELHSIRKALGAVGTDSLQVDAESIMLKSSAVDVDAHRFCELAATGDSQALGQAEQLYRGEFLSGLPPPTVEFGQWMEVERSRLRLVAIDVLTSLLEQERMPTADLAASARRLEAIDPYNESACQALMLFHAHRNEIGLASQVHGRFRDRLEAELKTHPSEATEALHRRILERRVKLASLRHPRVATRRRHSRLRQFLPLLSLAFILVVAVSWWQPWTYNLEAVDPATMAQPLPERPSIAVLPFDDLSQGDDRDYLSDAIADGIITELSYFSELFVIARNSSFQYRDRPADVREIARELGVRYLLEGSQQKDNDQLRVTVQLIDAVEGKHLWAERYDGDLTGLFVVQDAIARSVASRLGEKLTKIAGEDAKRADPARLSAYQRYLKGKRHFQEFTREGTEMARQEHLAALEVDPFLSHAHVGLAFVHLNGFRFGWLDLTRDDALQEARRHAQVALELTPDDYLAHLSMGYVHAHAGERAQAVARLERALELNPNSGDGMGLLAEVFVYLDRASEAVELLRRAMRLDPHHPDWIYWNLGWAQYYAGACEEGLATMRRMPSMPNLARRTVAALQVCLGRVEEARATIADLLQSSPGYTISEFDKAFRRRFEDPSALDRWANDLRLAGLPE